MKQSYKLGDESFALDAPAGEVALDQSRMSAGCVFAVNSLDRVGDVLDIAGIRTDNHRKNPQVLFNHKADSLDDAVGLTLDPDGNYTVVLGGDSAHQTTFFCQNNLLAEQLYDRIVAGQIRANSIGYRPLKKRKNTAGGFFLDEVELIEVSWVVIGANQDAIRSTLSRDRVCGKALHPALRSAYESQLKANPTVWVPGGYLMSKIAKAAEESKVNTKADTAASAARENVAKSGEVAEAPEPGLPHGAEMLAAYHGALAKVLEQCEKELPRLENERVGKLILKGVQAILKTMAAVEEAYKTEYPDAKALPDIATAALSKEEDDAAGEETAPREPDAEPKADDEPDVKSLARQVKALTDKLDTLLGHDAQDDEDDELLAELEALPEPEQKAAIAALREYVADETLAEQDEYREQLKTVHNARLRKAYDARTGR